MENKYLLSEIDKKKIIELKKEIVARNIETKKLQDHIFEIESAPTILFDNERIKLRNQYLPEYPYGNSEQKQKYDKAVRELFESGYITEE